MRWSVSLFYVLALVAIVELAASQAVAHAGFEVPVYAGPGEPLMLRVLPGQAFEDAALAFLELVC